MIVERHARADHVQQHRALMGDRRLQERDQLLGIAGERARDEVAPHLDRQGAEVDRRQLV